MKNIFKKTIVISIILLFIEVSLSSAISVDTKPTISKNEGVEDCGCEEVSESDLIKVERLLDRVEIYNKLLLVFSKHHPEILEDYEELTDMITTLNTLDLKDLICDRLFNIINLTGIISVAVHELIQKAPYNSIRYRILTAIWGYCYLIAFFINGLGVLLNCDFLIGYPIFT